MLKEVLWRALLSRCLMVLDLENFDDCRRLVFH